MTEPTPQINPVENIIMIMVALLFDAIPAVATFVTSPIGGVGGVIAGFIVWPFAWLTIFLWFTMRGVKFMGNKKRLATFMGAPILEFIPYLNNLPGWTFMVVMTSLTLRADKILKAADPQAKAKAKRRRV